HRDGDPQETNSVAGAVHLGRLEDLSLQAAQVVAQEEDLERQAVARMGEPDGDERARETKRVEELEDRDQRHLDRDHHQPDDDDEEDVLARKLHPGDGVGAHGRDGELDHSRRYGDQDAVEDRGGYVRCLQYLVVAVERKTMRWEQRAPPAGVAHVLHVPERVHDQPDRGHDPDRDEDDDHEVKRQSLQLVAPSVEDRHRRAGPSGLATSLDLDAAHRVSSCCWKRRMLTTSSGTMARKRTTPTAAARDKWWVASCLNI